MPDSCVLPSETEQGHWGSVCLVMADVNIDHFAEVSARFLYYKDTMFSFGTNK